MSDGPRRSIVMAFDNVAKPSEPTMSHAEVVRAVKARHHLRQHFGYLPVPIAFYLIFCGMALTHVPIQKMYPTENGLYSALVTSGTDAITSSTTMKFTNIGSQSDVFSWLSDTFIPTTFVTTDYTGSNLTAEFLHRVQLYHTILGAVELKTTTAALTSCGFSGALSVIYPHCHDASDLHAEYFYLDAGTTPTEATALVAAKEASGTWLSLGTTALEVTLATYDGELQMMNVVSLSLGFELGGHISLDSDIVAVPSNPYDGAGPIVLDVLVGLFFIAALTSEARRLYSRRGRRRLSDVVSFWYLVEWATLVGVVLYYVAWAILCSLIYGQELADLLMAVGGSGASFNHGTDAEAARASLGQLMSRFKLMGSVMTVVRIIAMVVMLCLVVRILSAMRFHPNLNVLTLTLAKSLALFGPFFCVYLVCLAGFVTAGHILFGGRLKAFSTIGYAAVTVINLAFGQFDFSSISDIDYSIALFWYWATLIVLFLVLFNMMLAIVLKAYDQVSDEHAGGDRSVLTELLVVAKEVCRPWGPNLPARFATALEAGGLKGAVRIGPTEIAAAMQVSETQARRLVRDLQTLAKVLPPIDGASAAVQLPDTTEVPTSSRGITLEEVDAKVDRLEKAMTQLLKHVEAIAAAQCPSIPALTREPSQKQ
ncbi:Polycystin Cation Channel (PCC) Family [Achlya hypogyna]|uniref:Polycystin Cation Channel (PCC) Family n=1 Tax=Achlya hypogyna TaxID=1202772 RepID=A0A1V9ZL32_ACHHY|nr:Polycystin Cation Channel (PCC) Family [Achlya hypogyna]